MNKLATIVASATAIASPVFETPADAVMVGLLAAIAAMGIATIMSVAVSSSAPDQPRLLSQQTCRQLPSLTDHECDGRGGPHGAG
jgi:hypothetical protein